jgi:hypothetical protein
MPDGCVEDDHRRASHSSRTALADDMRGCTDPRALIRSNSSSLVGLRATASIDDPRLA